MVLGERLKTNFGIVQNSHTPKIARIKVSKKTISPPHGQDWGALRENAE
jgi:hypothetical protein